MGNESDAGKGDDRRPLGITWQEWDDNYALAFGKKKKKPIKKKEKEIEKENNK